jgi:hypothetical protein
MKISDTLARDLVPHVRAAIEAILQGKGAELAETYNAILDALDLGRLPDLGLALESAARDIDPIDAETAVTPTFVQQLFAPLKPPLTDAEIEAKDTEWRRERRQEREDCRGTGMEMS